MGGAISAAATSPEQAKTRAPFNIPAAAEKIANKQHSPEIRKQRADALDQGYLDLHNEISYDYRHHLKHFDAQLFIDFLKQPAATQHTFFSIGYTTNLLQKWPGALKQMLADDQPVTNIMLDPTEEFTYMDVRELYTDLRSHNPKISEEETMRCIDKNLNAHYFSCALPNERSFEIHVESALAQGKVIYLNYGQEMQPDEWIKGLYNSFKSRYPDQIFFIDSTMPYTYIKKGNFTDASNFDRIVEGLYDEYGSIENQMRNPTTHQLPAEINGMPLNEYIWKRICIYANEKYGDAYEFLPNLQYRSKVLVEAAQRRAQKAKEADAKTTNSGGSGGSASTATAAAPADKP